MAANTTSEVQGDAIIQATSNCWDSSQDVPDLDAASDCTRDGTGEYNDSIDSSSQAGYECNVITPVFEREPAEYEIQRVPADLLGSTLAISSFVVAAMAGHGWHDVDQSHILVKECSGFEGRTFKVSANIPLASPPAVAFHVLHKKVAADPICKGRIAAAHAIFAAQGVSPARIVQGDDWFIDAWAGSKVGGIYELSRPKAAELPSKLPTELTATATATELGELLAKVHAIPIDWFEEWRTCICSRHPALLTAAGGSHLWPFTSRQDIFEGLPDECVRLWDQSGPTPASHAGARVVTSHSDFHPANVIRTEMGLQVIDFGLACVTCAAKDLSWMVEYVLHGLEEKRAFVRAYLKASGYAAGVEEVDALLLDAECFALHSFMGVLFGQLENLKQDPVHGLDEYLEFAAIAEDALTNESLRTDILERGLFLSSRYQALL